MLFERFTADARCLTIRAQELARELRAPKIEPAHLLLAVFDGVDTVTVGRLGEVGLTRDGLATALSDGPDPSEDDSRLLGQIGIDVGRIRESIDQRFGAGTFDAAGTNDVDGRRGKRRGGHLAFARTAKKSLELALREAQRLKDNRIGTPAVVLGILRSDDPVIDGLLDDDTQWRLRRLLEDDLRRTA